MIQSQHFLKKSCILQPQLTYHIILPEILILRLLKYGGMHFSEIQAKTVFVVDFAIPAKMSGHA